MASTAAPAQHSIGPQPTPPTASAATPTVPSKPAAPIPEYSFDGSVPAPKVINTGHDYVAILESLSHYANWLTAHHPDPNLMNGFFAPGTAQHVDFAHTLALMRDQHVREVEERGGANHYTIVSARPDAFSARVVEDVLLHEIVDSTGRVTSIARYSTPTTYSILAVLVGDHWELAAVDEVHAPTVHL